MRSELFEQTKLRSHWRPIFASLNFAVLWRCQRKFHFKKCIDPKDRRVRRKHLWNKNEFKYLFRLGQGSEVMKYLVTSVTAFFDKMYGNWSKCQMDFLTHWGRDEIDAISQTPFSNAFSWMKMNDLRLGFHWSLFLRSELTIFHHWFR